MMGKGGGVGGGCNVEVVDGKIGCEKSASPGKAAAARAESCRSLGAND